MDDARFSTVPARLRHIGKWYALRNAAFAARTTAEWLDILLVANVPAMPCHSLHTLHDDPHLVAVGLIGGAEHGAEGQVRTIRPTVIADGVTTLAQATAPLLGADAIEVLARFGFSTAEMEAMRRDGTLTA